MMQLTKHYLMDRIRDVMTEDDLTVLLSPHKKTNASIAKFATTRIDPNYSVENLTEFLLYYDEKCQNYPGYFSYFFC